MLARPALAVLLLALGTAPLAAQSVSGRVLAEEGGEPLPGARLLLLDPRGSPVDSTLADRDGRFRLRAPGPGMYNLYFQKTGFAGVPSGVLDLAPGTALEYEFRVPLLSSAALRRMSDILALEPRLQKPLPEMCGEEFRPREAGLLVGVVRDRDSGAPLAGARVTVGTPGNTARSAISSERGIYYLCNVSPGQAVQVTVLPPGRAAHRTSVEIRAGTVAWFDLPIPPASR